MRALALLLLAAALAAADPVRGFRICVAADAPAGVRADAQRVLTAAAAGTHPTLAAFGAAPTALSDSRQLAAGPAADRAYAHLVLVGLADDPLIRSAWQREARVHDDGSWYCNGFGLLRGSLGWIESDRNPFLHARGISYAPFEAEVVTLTGSDAAGVTRAVDAFLQAQVVNGLVAAPGWSRPRAGLLDRAPSALAGSPLWLPAQVGTATRIGFTMGGDDDIRTALEDGQVRPLAVWIARYWRPGHWDLAGQQGAVLAYMRGLHRRAYADAVWLARYPTAADAAAAAPKLAAAAGLTANGSWWTGAQPHWSWETTSAGDLACWATGAWVAMSALPLADSTALRAAMAPPVPPADPANQAPVARVGAQPASATAPMAVVLDGSASSDADGGIDGWTWSIPGATVSGSGSRVIATWATAGIRTVTLTVRDDRGATAQASVTVTALAPDPAAGTLGFAAATVHRVEAGGTASLVVRRVGGSTGAVSVAWSTADGTASAGADYTAAGGTLTWAAGDAGDRVMSIALRDDALVEADETVRVLLATPTGGAVLGTAEAAVVIDDDDVYANRLANPGFEADADGSQTITAWASWSGRSTLDADSVLAGGSHGGLRQLAHRRGATGTWNVYTSQTVTGLEPGLYRLRAWARRSGTGFTACTLEVKDHGGAKRAVPVADADHWQLLEIPAIAVTAGSATIGFFTEVVNGSGTPTARFDDVEFVRETPGVVGFASAAASVPEGGAEGTLATLTLVRTDGSDGLLEIAWTTAPGSATPGEDYLPVSGTVLWPSGDGAAKAITVPVLADRIAEGDETVTVGIAILRGGSRLGIATATLTIHDDDGNAPPVITAPAGAAPAPLVLP